MRRYICRRVFDLIICFSCSMRLCDFLRRLERCELLSVSEVAELTQIASLVLLREPNVVRVSSPCVIVGDIHGQFSDLLEIFRLFGAPPSRTFVFLGDYVDRGRQSLETALTLLCLKAMHPKSITLLRGNHETSTVSRDLGLSAELTARYALAAPAVHTLLAATFRLLPCACLIDGRCLCVHGGLSPIIHTTSAIATLDRTAVTQAYSDLLWSDPGTDNGYQRSTRGLGYLFGPDVTNAFLTANNLYYLVRGHQYMKEGFKIHFKDRNVATVWSAPRYMYFFDNIASVLFYNGTIKNSAFKTFKDVNTKNNQPKND